jgi:hypothetical protein
MESLHERRELGLKYILKHDPSMWTEREAQSKNLRKRFRWVASM